MAASCAEEGKGLPCSTGAIKTCSQCHNNYCDYHGFANNNGIFGGHICEGDEPVFCQVAGRFPGTCRGEATKCAECKFNFCETHHQGESTMRVVQNRGRGHYCGAIMCQSTFGHNCATTGGITKCRYCEYKFCKHHANPVRHLLSGDDSKDRKYRLPTGGHVCKYQTWGSQIFGDNFGDLVALASDGVVATTTGVGYALIIKLTANAFAEAMSKCFSKDWTRTFNAIGKMLHIAHKLNALYRDKAYDTWDEDNAPEIEVEESDINQINEFVQWATYLNNEWLEELCGDDLITDDDHSYLQAFKKHLQKLSSVISGNFIVEKGAKKYLSPKLNYSLVAFLKMLFFFHGMYDLFHKSKELLSEFAALKDAATGGLSANTIVSTANELRRFSFKLIELFTNVKDILNNQNEEAKTASALTKFGQWGASRATQLATSQNEAKTDSINIYRNGHEGKQLGNRMSEGKGGYSNEEQDRASVSEHIQAERNEFSIMERRIYKLDLKVDAFGRKHELQLKEIERMIRDFEYERSDQEKRKKLKAIRYLRKKLSERYGEL
mmetsp:Transcript_26068/g.38546  ORF Transcript_26068/g.38546 Transcript_26068/m.38546 type:complete len:551 (-) Transcript_26068:167-1819(-)